MSKNIKDLKGLTLSQLETLLQDLQSEQRKIRFDMIVATVENPARIKTVRRDIARVKTVIREMELGLRKTNEK